MPFGIGLTELLVILIIVLIIFGAGKLPEIGSGLGKAIRNFKDATSSSSGGSQVERNKIAETTQNTHKESENRQGE
ncbi:MAG: twin-arginine translocase TatA/TatE family subunit [bacterium]|nr:twin-arginine translocase TatA/TatE family subunit [bacterium]